MAAYNHNFWDAASDWLWHMAIIVTKWLFLTRQSHKHSQKLQLNPHKCFQGVYFRYHYTSFTNLVNNNWRHGEWSFFLESGPFKRVLPKQLLSKCIKYTNQRPVEGCPYLLTFWHCQVKLISAQTTLASALFNRQWPNASSVGWKEIVLSIPDIWPFWYTGTGL